MQVFILAPEDLMLAGLVLVCVSPCVSSSADAHDWRQVLGWVMLTETTDLG